MIVMKFGGSCLRSAERIAAAHSIVATADRSNHRRGLIVVVSALDGTTDLLLSAAAKTLVGQVDPGQVVAKQTSILSGLGLTLSTIETPLNDLIAALESSARRRTLERADLDRILSFGERAAARTVASAFDLFGTPSEPVNAARSGLVRQTTDGKISADRSQLTSEAIRSRVPVITGFIGHGPNGKLTTLGRNGSDSSATALALTLAASEVRIYKDVDGILSCDPTDHDETSILRELSFPFASDLAHLGASVLHKSSMIPLVKRKIPARVVSMEQPFSAGTRITHLASSNTSLSVGFVVRKNVTALSIRSPNNDHRSEKRATRELEQLMVLVRSLGFRDLLLLKDSSRDFLIFPTVSPRRFPPLDAMRRVARHSWLRWSQGKDLVLVVSQTSLPHRAKRDLDRKMPHSPYSVYGTGIRKDRTLGILVDPKDRKATLQALHRWQCH